MAEKDYVSVAGFVQFEPNEREMQDGRTVRDITIRAIGSQELVRVTLWDSFEDVSVDRGDFVAVDGAATTREVEGTVYYNVSAYNLVVAAPVEQRERETTKSSTTKSSAKAKKAPF